MTIRRYSELKKLETIEERFGYLQLRGNVGSETFGFDRYLNQDFYSSWEWKQARNEVIARDLGCDLGLDGYEIFDKVYVHHMNPISVTDITHFNEEILDPEYLICVTHRTHNAIHYGNEQLLPRGPIVRRPGDTKLW